MKTLTYRSFLKLFVLLMLSVFGLVGTINFIVDPMDCFTDRPYPAFPLLGFNDRQQKCNYAVDALKKDEFDALLLGNSRVVLMDQNSFSPLRVFNFAVCAMQPWEYDAYLVFAERLHGGKPFKYVFIGLSFANANLILAPGVELPTKYFDRADRPHRSLDYLFSFDTCRFSCKTIKFMLYGDKKVHFIYDRRNVAHTNKANTDDPVRKHALFNDVLSGYRNIYRSFSYSSEGFKKALSDLKAKHPNSKFIVFTTPVSRPMFCLIAESGLTMEYERWLRDIVDIFGRVYHFEYSNSVADNHENYFYDASHFEPVVGAMVADRIMGRDSETVPADFGMVIDANNVDKAMSLMMQDLRACRSESGASH